jgi:hypothetical protein
MESIVKTIAIASVINQGSGRGGLSRQDPDDVMSMEVCSSSLARNTAQVEQKKVTLKFLDSSNEHLSFDVSKDVAEKIQLLTDNDDFGLDAEKEVEVSLSRNILESIFCQKCKESGWNEEFVQDQKVEDLFKIIQAADYLQIKSLLKKAVEELGKKLDNDRQAFWQSLEKFWKSLEDSKSVSQPGHHAYEVFADFFWKYGQMKEMKRPKLFALSKAIQGCFSDEDAENGARVIVKKIIQKMKLQKTFGSCDDQSVKITQQQPVEQFDFKSSLIHQIIKSPKLYPSSLGTLSRNNFWMELREDQPIQDFVAYFELWSHLENAKDLKTKDFANVTKYWKWKEALDILHQKNFNEFKKKLSDCVKAFKLLEDNLITIDNAKKAEDVSIWSRIFWIHAHPGLDNHTLEIVIESNKFINFLKDMKVQNIPNNILEISDMVDEIETNDLDFDENDLIDVVQSVLLSKPADLNL